MKNRLAFLFMYTILCIGILIISPYPTNASPDKIVQNLYLSTRLALTDFEKCIKGDNATIFSDDIMPSLIPSPSSMPLRMCHITANDEKQIEIYEGSVRSCSSSSFFNRINNRFCLTTVRGQIIQIAFSRHLKEKFQTLIRIAWGNFLGAKIVGTRNDISAKLYEINEINRLLKLIFNYYKNYEKRDIYPVNHNKHGLDSFFQDLFKQQQLSAILLTNTDDDTKSHKKRKLDSHSTFSQIRSSTDTVNSATLIKMNDEMVSVVKKSDDVSHAIDLMQRDKSLDSCAAEQDATINEKIVSQMNFHWNNFFNLTTTYYLKKSHKLITAFDKSVGDLADIIAMDGEEDFLNNLDRDAAQRYVISAFLFKHQDSHIHNILIDIDPVSGKYILRSIDHGRELSPNPSAQGTGQFRASLFSDLPTSDGNLEDAPLKFIKNLDAMSEYQFFINKVMSEYDKKDHCYNAIHRMVKDKAQHFLANILTLKKLVEHNKKHPLKIISLNDLISYSRMVPQTHALKKSFLIYMAGQLSSSRETIVRCDYQSFYLDADTNDQWNSVYHLASTSAHNEKEFFNIFSELISGVFDLGFENMPPKYYSPFRDTEKMISDPIIIDKISKMVDSYTMQTNPYHPDLEEDEYNIFNEEHISKNKQQVMGALPVYLQNLIKTCEINNFL